MQVIPDFVRHHAWLRLLLVPDEVGLIHRLFRASRELPHSMIDVGAHTGSTLRPFTADGWRVWAFEPDPLNRTKLTAAFGCADNVTIDARALSDKAELALPFFGSSVSSGISSLHAFHASHVSHTRVDTITLAQVCGEYGIDRVGLLKIDVEGHDLAVLRGADWQKIRPAIVVCEFEDAKTRVLGHSYRALGDYLLERRYSVLLSEWYPVEEYGRAHRWRGLRRYPCELVDSRAFGNFIACHDPAHARMLERAAWKLALPWRCASALRQSLER